MEKWGLDQSWDVFICHASEDKQSLVDPLAAALSEAGAKVWYDDFELRVGDSLSRSIDKGLASSSFGLVILSRAFFRKSWTDYELRSLISKEVDTGKTILPIWHGITRAELLKRTPYLADKFALQSRRHSIEDLCISVLNVVRPDLFSQRLRRILFSKPNAHLKPAQVKDAPIRHRRLSDDAVHRIGFLRACFLEVLPQTKEEWVNNFRRDTNPMDEIQWWENLAECYLEVCSGRDVSLERKGSIFAVLLMYWSATELDNAVKDTRNVNAEDESKIREVIRSVDLKRLREYRRPLVVGNRPSRSKR